MLRTTLMTTTAIVVTLGMAAGAQAQQAGGDIACDDQFVKVDQDNSGTISKSEAQTAADTEFSRVDADGNGTVSAEEWYSCNNIAILNETYGLNKTYGSVEDDMPQRSDQASAQGQMEQGSADPSTSNQAAMEQGSAQDPSQVWYPWPGESFADADMDKSGGVSRGEAAQFAAKQAGENLSEEQARELGWRYSTVDADSDGNISMEEWKSRASAGDRQGQDRPGQDIASIDQNSDDKISSEEWNEYMGQRFAQARQNQEGEPVTIYRYYYLVR